MPKRESLSVVLGALTPSEVTEGPPGLNEEDPAIPAQMASPTKVSPQAVMSEDVPSITHISHSPSPPTMPKILEAASTFPIPQLQAAPRVDSAGLPDEVFWLQGQMNVVLEWLHSLARATTDSHCRELELNTKLAMYMNEAQATEIIKAGEVSHAAEVKETNVHHTVEIKEAKVYHATTIKGAKLCYTTRIKQAEACHTTNSCVLQQTHGESKLALEHEVIEVEGQDY